MAKAKFFVRAFIRHWWVGMGIVLGVLGLVPVVTYHTIPRWIYWLAALICIVIGFYQTWSEEYDRAELCQRELDEMYADVVLDCLKQKKVMIFTSQHVAKWLDWPLERVQRGLKMLEKEFGVVKDNGARGWTFDLTVSIPLYCHLRKLPSPPQA